MGRLKLFSISNLIMVWTIATVLGLNPTAQMAKAFNLDSTPAASTAPPANAAITAAFDQSNPEFGNMLGRIFKAVTTETSAAAGQKVSNNVPVHYAFVQIPM